MTTILTISDDGMSSGFGRISAVVNKGLQKRGYQIIAQSLAYDSLLPARYDGEILPYHVGALQPYTVPTPGRPFWTDCVLNVINAVQPDIIWVTQDAPYGTMVRNLPLDWSKYAFIITTPVDGAPIYPEWVEMVKNADAALTISEYGVKAFAQQGASVGLCRPGVDTDKFYRLPDEQRREWRAKMGLADNYVVGTFCMNQGRKCISMMLEAFMEFSKGHPEARFWMDMEEQSPAGWNIPALCQQAGWDINKLVFRRHAMERGVTDLNARYNCLDMHMVISHREGFGLPLVEAQAAGVLSMAQDYCSGTEICGNGNGVLVKPSDVTVLGTWGGARDFFPDMKDFVEKLEWIYANPTERAAIAERGMKEARSHTWTPAIDAAQAAVEKALAKRKPKAVVMPMMPALPPVVAPSPDGMSQQVALIENKG